MANTPVYVTETWPIEPGTEITYKHFDDLRRLVFSKMFPWAGTKSIASLAVIGKTAWDNYWKSFFGESGEYWARMTDGNLDQDCSYFNYLINFVYGTSTANVDTFVPADRLGFNTFSTLLAHPPLKADGTIDSGYWKWGVNITNNGSYIHRYHDFDTYSGRYIGVRTSIPADAGGGGLYDIQPACRYLPAMTGPKYQKPFVRYANNNRYIPARSSLEINWQHLFQPNIVSRQIPVSKIWVMVPIGASKWVKGWLNNPPMLGYQYCWPCGTASPPYGGEAQWDQLPNEGVGDTQKYGDNKLCSAYQAFVEWIAEAFNWVYPTIKDDEFKAAYNAKYGSIDVPSPYDPTVPWNAYALLNDECWCCHRSGFELILKRLKKYDWWYDTIGDLSLAFLPDCVYDARAWHLAGDVANPKTGESAEEVLARWFPLQAATVRRTWRYGGRPLWGCFMASGEGSSYSVVPKHSNFFNYPVFITDPPYPEYPWAQQGVAVGEGGVWYWPGKYVHWSDLPSIEGELERTQHPEVTEDEARYLLSLRHDPILPAEYVEDKFVRMRYELNMMHLMNDMYSVLGGLKHRALGQLYVGLKYLHMPYAPLSSTIAMYNTNTIYKKVVADTKAIPDDPLSEHTNPDSSADTGCQATVDTGNVLDTPPGSRPISCAVSSWKMGMTIAYDGGGTMEWIPDRNVVFIALIKPYGVEVYEQSGTKPNPVVYLRDTPLRINGQDCLMSDGEVIPGVPNFNPTYYWFPRPSTGVPDPIPASWEEWGGFNGRIVEIKVSTNDIIPVPGQTNQWLVTFDMNWPTDTDPDIVATTGQDSHVIYSSRFHMLMVGVGNGIDALVDANNPNIPDSVFSDSNVSYKQFTEVAVDPNKFDDEGYEI